MRLAQFVVTPETRSPLLAVRRVAKAVLAGRSAPEASPLYLHGPPGVGKSHLAQGLIAEVCAGDSPRTARLVIAGDLAAGFPVSEASDDWRGSLSCDLLVLEDLQHVADRAVPALARAVDHRVCRGLPLVVTANVGPGLLHNLPPQLTSRLGCGLVIGLDLPGLQSRRYLLERLAQRQRLATAAGVLDWIAEQTTGGVRQSCGALTALAALSAGLPESPSLATVQQRWTDLTPRKPAANVERIVQHVARYYAVKPRDLQCRSRHAQTLWPLQVAMYLVREQMCLPWARIGVAFGGRDSSTVRHAMRKVAERADNDPATASALRQLRAEVA